jgi:hypothetical protein
LYKNFLHVDIRFRNQIIPKNNIKDIDCTQISKISDVDSEAKNPQGEIATKLELEVNIDG